MRRTRSQLIIYLVSISTLLYLTYVSFIINKQNLSAIRPNLLNSTNKLGQINQSKFRILTWNKYYGGEWQQYYTEGPCSVQCDVTSDRRQFMSSDIVVFHLWDMDFEDLPPFKRSGQKWVINNREPPNRIEYILWRAMKAIDNRLDWTMDYRRETDIYLPYGSVIPCHRKWTPKKDLFERKNRSIAWIVSNCETPSRREDMVSMLKKYIDVDVYGKCGDHECHRSDQSCYRMIAQNYKFYLSFENALCKDYATEKLFRTLGLDIIPVVYGLYDYKNLLPNNSYIDVMDFKSVRHLAQYLREVSEDKDKYLSYLKWKSSHCVNWVANHVFCKLCEKFHNQSNNTQNSQPPKASWFRFTDCTKPNFREF